MELKTREGCEPSALQKSADFIHAFLLGAPPEHRTLTPFHRASLNSPAPLLFLTGFEVNDAIALLRLDDLYIECFEVKDVKQARLLSPSPVP